MTEFIKRGNTFVPTSREEMDLHQTLPTGNYVVKVDQFGGYFLERTVDFKLPSKIYGSPLKNAKRILNTFNDRPGNTGILLAGEKGSGKTLLTKLLSILAAKEGFSTIMINERFYGDEFNTFIQKIDQPCIILFDEFEKTYAEKEQEKLLTLLDGVFTTKKMFILTSNRIRGISEFFQNRPGRIYYSLTYEGIDEEVVREYCEENLNDRSAIDSVISYTNMTNLFNFDMLVALVEEMNRYNESVKESIKFLNIKVNDYNELKYTYKIEANNKIISIGTLYHNPLMHDPGKLYIEPKDEIDVGVDEPVRSKENKHVPSLAFAQMFNDEEDTVSSEAEDNSYVFVSRNDFVRMNNTGTEFYFLTKHPKLGVVQITFSRDFSRSRTIHDYI